MTRAAVRETSGLSFPGSATFRLQDGSLLTQSKESRSPSPVLEGGGESL